MRGSSTGSAGTVETLAPATDWPSLKSKDMEIRHELDSLYNSAGF